MEAYMKLSDLTSIISFIAKQKTNNKKKKVLLDGFYKYEVNSIQNESIDYYLSNIEDSEYNRIKKFFIFNEDILSNILDKKITLDNINKDNHNEIFKNNKNNSIKFLTDKKGSIVILPIKDSQKIYGLGSKFSNFERKGKVFDNYNIDNPYHFAFSDNLYSTLNIFYILDEDEGKTDCYIIDYPGFIRYDFCKTDKNEIRIKISSTCFQILHFKKDNFIDAVKMLYKIPLNLYKPPFHSFGYTYSHWGIKSIDDIDKLVNNHLKENIPISNICLDIDYMDSYKNFTINNNYGNFEGFKNFNLSLKSKNIFLIPIIDAGIKIEKGYSPYEEFAKSGCCVKKDNKENYTGTVWPGNCIFPDFFTEKAEQIFKELMKDWIEKTDTNGCWLDMNEPSVFNEKTRTISDNAKFLNGEVENLKIHNMYPYNQAKITYESFIEKGKRAMIFSRSFYTFMNQFCGNWTGDNQPTFTHLKTGFQQIISLSLSAVMYAGTDIGGFWFNPSNKLLIKWFKAALFHPLFRNHSSIFAKPREISSLNGNCKNKIKKIIETRYMLLPTIYSLFMTSIYYRKPYIMPYVYKENNKTIVESNVIIISETIGYDPFDTGLLEKDSEFAKYQINGIDLYIKKGKAILLSSNISIAKSIFEFSQFNIIGNPDNDNKFEFEIYFDDGISTKSLDNFGIYRIIFEKDIKNNTFKRNSEIIFSNLNIKSEMECDKIIKNIDIDIL